MEHANNPGNTVFAVLLDEQGNLLARSANYVLPNTSASVSLWQAMALPQPTRVSGRAFFVGLAQIAPTTAGQYFFPLARQTEAPVRDSAYYSVVGDSALTGLKPPREFRTLGSFMIEAGLITAPLAIRPALAPLAAADVWPNPAAPGIPVQVRLSASPIGATIVLDATGRTVWRGLLLPSTGAREYSLPLKTLPPGLYILQFQTANSKQINKRLIIE